MGIDLALVINAGLVESCITICACIIPRCSAMSVRTGSTLRAAFYSRTAGPRSACGWPQGGEDYVTETCDWNVRSNGGRWRTAAVTTLWTHGSGGSVLPKTRRTSLIAGPSTKKPEKLKDRWARTRFDGVPRAISKASPSFSASFPATGSRHSSSEAHFLLPSPATLRAT